jgi:type IV pilus assembly protein PilW
MKHHAHRGFSLVELMVSITLGLIVLAVLATVFANTSRARAELERSSQQVDNGRYAVDVLTHDLQLAGYYGELDIAAIAVPAVLPDVCSTDPVVWNAALPIHMQGAIDGGAMPACMPPSMKAGTDVVAVRRARTCVAGTADCDAVVATEPYVQVGLCSSTPAPYALGIAADTAFPLQLKDCATAAGLRRYATHIYFVSNDNGSGTTVPTLKRLELAGGVFTEVALVEGIERLRVEYGIDTNGDGGPDAYTSDPNVYTYAGCGSCTPPQNWANVVTAKLHVLSRALETTPGYVNTKVFEMGIDDAGNAVRIGPFNDAYRRQLYSAALRVMNVSGRRDAP